MISLLTNTTKSSLKYLLLATLVFSPFAALPSNANEENNSNLIQNDPLAGYFAKKEQIHEDTGFTWNINYSVMGVKRTNGTKDQHFTGQLDLMGSLSLFKNKGQLAAYYMDIQQISGITNEEFSNRNGNLIQISDSDPVSFLRQFWYAHKFLDDKLTLTGGITEPTLVFAPNRFAADDRANFQMVPLSTVAAKDRLGGSEGLMVSYKVNDNWFFGTSANTLNSSLDNPTIEELRAYYMFNVTFSHNSEQWGEGNYRFISVLTEEEGDNKRTNGFIVSIDQDITKNWGVFLRYDDTELQTLTSTINQSNAFGFYNQSPFGRSVDDFGIGLTRVKSDVGGNFKEWGGEMFYRIGIADWVNLSLTAQYIDASKAPEGQNSDIFNVGGRVFFSF